MAQLHGSEIKFKKALKPVEISWKHGSTLGSGGDKKETYDVMIYTLSANGANILVFVQENLDVPKTTVIDERFQFGCQNGTVFLVLHDKSNKPYQFRFVENKGNLAEWAKHMNEITKRHGVDLSWIAGDYLRDF